MGPDRNCHLSHEPLRQLDQGGSDPQSGPLCPSAPSSPPLVALLLVTGQGLPLASAISGTLCPCYLRSAGPACSREGWLAGAQPPGETIRTTAGSHHLPGLPRGQSCLLLIKFQQADVEELGPGSCPESRALYPKLSALAISFGISYWQNLLAWFSSVSAIGGLLGSKSPKGKMR